MSAAGSGETSRREPAALRQVRESALAMLRSGKTEEGFEYLDAPVVRITAPDTPVPYSPPLEDFWMPKKDDVIRAGRRLLDY